jgi:hypothetical protein
MKRYWISRRNDAQGPYPAEELQVMMVTGEIQTSDQIRLESQPDWQAVREVLKNKPSVLQREWNKDQARQAGFAVRFLLVITVIVWLVPALQPAAAFVSLALLSLAALLAVFQWNKGERHSARIHLVLACVAMPVVCWLLAQFLQK